jgi:glycosyltransferase involved in cell wall biosynthesis
MMAGSAMLKPHSFRVVIPARNAAWCIEECMSGLAAAGFEPNDIFVVDDGSKDATAALARNFGAVVISDPIGSGAAASRNRGAKEADVDILLFVDADVVVHPDLHSKLSALFSENPDIDAVFGAYDDSPSCPSPVSKYRNLLHHYVHSSGPSRPKSFWTGCGAVRRVTFDRLGGFDDSQRMMEDVEFGMRLTDDGGIVALDPALCGKHLKSWTVLSMARSDLFDRAIPWTRLMLFGGRLSAELNLGWKHRMSAALTAVIWLGLVIAPFVPSSLIVVAIAFFCFILTNRGFFLLVRRSAGGRAAIAAIALHMLHYTSALVGFSWVFAFEYIPRRILCAGSVAQMALGDSSRESSVIAGAHERTAHEDLQDAELAHLQQGADASTRR